MYFMPETKMGGNVLERYRSTMIHVCSYIIIMYVLLAEWLVFWTSTQSTPIHFPV